MPGTCSYWWQQKIQQGFRTPAKLVVREGVLRLTALRVGARLTSQELCSTAAPVPVPNLLGLCPVAEHTAVEYLVNSDLETEERSARASRL